MRNEEAFMFPARDQSQLIYSCVEEIVKIYEKITNCRILSKIFVQFWSLLVNALSGNVTLHIQHCSAADRLVEPILDLNIQCRCSCQI